jgi:hypothetical protein
MAITKSRGKDGQEPATRLLIKIMLIVIAILVAVTGIGLVLDAVLKPGPTFWA